MASLSTCEEATTLGTAISGSLKELAYRESDSLEVTLLWSERHNQLTVSVLDRKTGQFFALEAPRDKALDVFYHPYVYATPEAFLKIDEPLAA